MYKDSYIWQLRQRIGHELIMAPGAQVLVLGPEGRILLQKRRDNGIWELPAGACEPHQSFVDCAVSELLEETGIDLDPNRFVAFGSISGPDLHRLHYPNGDVVQAYAICFAVTLLTTPSITLEADEVVQYTWAKPDDLPMPLHRPTEEAVAMYATFKKTGAFIAN